MARAGATGQAIGLALVAVLIFTVMDAVAKQLTQHYSAFQVTWARYAGHGMIVVVLLAPRLRSVLRTRVLGSHVLRSVFQVGAGLSFFGALGYIGLAEATAIADINPVLITLGAAIFLGEKLGRRRLFGVLAALIGALIIIRPGLGVFSAAALLPLVTAICYSGYALVTRRLGASESVWTSMLYTALIGTLLTSAMLPWHWRPVAMPHLPLFLLIGALGATAQLCLIRAFTLAEASVVAPFSYAGLLFATLWGALFFDEMPDLWTGVGALVIVAAGLYVWHRETRAAAAAREAGGDGGQRKA